MPEGHSSRWTFWFVDVRPGAWEWHERVGSGSSTLLRLLALPCPAPLCRLGSRNTSRVWKTPSGKFITLPWSPSLTSTFVVCIPGFIITATLTWVASLCLWEKEPIEQIRHCFSSPWGTPKPSETDHLIFNKFAVQRPLKHFLFPIRTIVSIC